MAKKGSNKKKIKIPKSIFELRLSEKKFAKKHNIRLKGKGMSKKGRKEAQKKLTKVYSESAIVNLNKAVRILSENPGDGKQVMKLKAAVDNILMNPDVMERIAKLYKKNPQDYPNLIFFPYMVVLTISYYNQESLSDDEKEEGRRLDKEALLLLCERILKSQIKHYRKHGMNNSVSFELACVIPTAKLLNNSRIWYKRLIQKLYDIADENNLDLVTIFDAIRTIDGKKKKKKSITKAEFLEGFYSEFILRKSSNKVHAFTDTQKELQENLIDSALTYMDGLKEKKLREILKLYIKRRKTAESYKNDGKRVIKFIDHANSNSPYGKIKSVVQDLISDNSNNELYLS